MFKAPLANLVPDGELDRDPAEVANAIGSVSAGQTIDFQPEQETFDEPTHRFVEFTPEGTFEPVAEDSVIAETARADIIRMRNSILELPSDEEGLPMDHVDSHRQTMGCPFKPRRILSPQNYELAKRIYYGDEAKSGDEHDGGEFFGLLDVIIVKRDREEEKRYGTGITESRIVHEDAHSSGRSPETQLRIEREKQRNGRGLRRSTLVPVGVSDYESQRAGFATYRGTEKSGFFMEEIYAELERGLYVVNDLGLPHGFIEETTEPGQPAAMLTKYVFPRAGQHGAEETKLAPGALGAAMLELLIARDPELLTVIRAHRHSPETLDEAVGGRMDQIDPGLYEEVLALNIDDPEYYKAAAYLFKRVWELP